MRRFANATPIIVGTITEVRTAFTYIVQIARLRSIFDATFIAASQQAVLRDSHCAS